MSPTNSSLESWISSLRLWGWVFGDRGFGYKALDELWGRIVMDSFISYHLVSVLPNCPPCRKTMSVVQAPAVKEFKNGIYFKFIPALVMRDNYNTN